MQFYEWKDFRKSINAMFGRGGHFKRAALEVEALLGRLGDIEAYGGDPFRGMNLTHHGESRIKHCRKYDLDGYARLITVQTDGYCILVHLADHDDCDRWLNSHAGWEPVVGINNRVVATFRSRITEGRVARSEELGHWRGKLFERLPEDAFEQLTAGAPRAAIRKLEQLEATYHVEDLVTLLEPVEGEQRAAIFDVFEMLKRDQLGPALARVKLFAGEMTPLDDVAEEQLPDIVDSDVIRRIDPRSPQYREALSRFMKTARYRDWMTFLHPDQEQLVYEDFAGPAKLVGVSGSGKTCVVVKRAIRLAEKYPDGRILVLTLNRALAALIDELVTACASDQVRDRVEVRPFFELCKELMLRFDPAGMKTYDEITWKMNEHIDEIWQQFYHCLNNNTDAAVLDDLHDSLIARGYNAEVYLREEIDWLRSALKPSNRREYLQIDRVGRKVPLLPPAREKVLQGAAAWEEMMRWIGAIDGLGIAQALSHYLELIKPEYRCILVDEVQDFGNVELELVRSLVPPGENDLFLCGDAAQAVTSKHQVFRHAGIEVLPSRSRELTLNYRNSRDILTVAFEMLYSQLELAEDLISREDLHVLQPQYSAYSGSVPLMLTATSLEEEVQCALAEAQSHLKRAPSLKICIAICGFTILELTRFGQNIDLPVLDGTISIDEGSVFLSDLEQTKGFEFDMVFILNCSEGVIPDPTTPVEEQFRSLARLYVAMTRAKTDLYVSCSGQESPFFVGVAADTLLRAPWSEYQTAVALPSQGTPVRLAVHHEDGAPTDWHNMTGPQFLRSRYALNVSIELSAKIRLLVDGRGLRRGSKSLKWKTMGMAAEDFRREMRVRNLWGSAVSLQLDELLERLESSSTSLSGRDHVTHIAY